MPSWPGIFQFSIFLVSLGVCSISLSKSWWMLTFWLYFKYTDWCISISTNANSKFSAKIEHHAGWWSIRSARKPMINKNRIWFRKWSNWIPKIIVLESLEETCFAKLSPFSVVKYYLLQSNPSNCLNNKQLQSTYWSGQQKTCWKLNQNKNFPQCIVW